jgi:hypothetical protein
MAVGTQAAPAALTSHSSKLEDQAATAALYAVHPERKKSNSVLDANGKLSSASMYWQYPDP